MGRSVALAGASIVGLVALLTVARSSHAASSAGVLIEVQMRTSQYAPGAAARPGSTVAGKYCEPTLEHYVRQMARMVLRQGKGDACTNRYKEAAGTVTFTKNCRRPVPTSTYGAFRMANGSTFAGTVATGYLMAGQLITIDAEYSGKRVGTCKYPQPAK